MTKYNNADDVQLTACYFERFDGQRQIDCLPFFLQLELTASFGKTIYGSLTIANMADLLNQPKYGLIGEEFLIVEFKSPAVKNARRYKFVCSKISSMGRTDQHESELLAIELVSVDYYVNAGMLISRGYAGKVSNIVKDILARELKTEIAIGTFEETDGETKWAFTRQKPLEKIETLVEYAFKNEQSPLNYFTFYENFDGYNFQSFRNIMEEKKDEQPITYTYTPLAINDPNRPPTYILDYNVNNVRDAIGRIYYGNYRTNVYSYDFFSKTFDKKTFLLSQNYQKQNYINETSMGTSSPLVQRLERMHGLDYFIPQDRSNPNALIDATVGSGPFTSMMAEHMMAVKVNGNSLLDIGKPIRLIFPSISPTSKRDTGQDSNMSGRYIVHTCTHRINNESGTRFSYKQELLVVRNSTLQVQSFYDESYAGETVNIPALEQFDAT